VTIAPNRNVVLWPIQRDASHQTAPMRVLAIRSFRTQHGQLAMVAVGVAALLCSLKFREGLNDIYHSLAPHRRQFDRNLIDVITPELLISAEN
jgi:hypothetical protein